MVRVGEHFIALVQSATTIAIPISLREFMNSLPCRVDNPSTMSLRQQEKTKLSQVTNTAVNVKGFMENTKDKKTRYTSTR